MTEIVAKVTEIKEYIAALHKETEDLEYIECSHCRGVGEVLAEDYLDHNSVEALRAELVASITDIGDYGIAGKERLDRVHRLTRVAWLASRVAWLEAVDEQTEKMKRSVAEAALNRMIERGEIVRLSTGGVLSADEFYEAECSGCGTPTRACSASQGKALDAGDCCPKCTHRVTPAASKPTSA